MLETLPLVAALLGTPPDAAPVEEAPLFIDTDMPDAGVPEPRLPLPPADGPPKVLRPQPVTSDPPELLARALDPAGTSPGCFGWTLAARVAACVVGASSLQGGGVWRLELPGERGAPYVLWTEQTIHEGGRAIPADPVETDAARARLATLAPGPLGDLLEMEGPGQLFLEAAAPARVVWKARKVRSEGHPLSGTWEVERHTIQAHCGARRARLFEAEIGGRTGGDLRLWVLDGGAWLLAELTARWAVEGDSGLEVRAALVPLGALCQRKR